MEKVIEARKVLRELFGDISDLSDLSDNDSGPAKTEMGFIQPTAPAPRYKIPKIGSSIQRGDTASRRRAILLAEPIPPRPARRRNTGVGEKRRPPPKTKLERSWDFKRPVPAAPVNREQQQPGLTPSMALPPTQPAATTREQKQPRFAPIGAAPSTERSRLWKRPEPPSTTIVAATTVVPAGQNPSGIVAATTIMPSTQKPAGEAITITVRLPTGEEIPVPFFPGARNKKYRIRTGSGKWVVRFDNIGRPRYFRRC